MVIRRICSFSHFCHSRLVLTFLYLIRPRKSYVDILPNLAIHSVVRSDLYVIFYPSNDCFCEAFIDAGNGHRSFRSLFYLDRRPDNRLLNITQQSFLFTIVWVEQNDLVVHFCSDQISLAIDVCIGSNHFLIAWNLTVSRSIFSSLPKCKAIYSSIICIVRRPVPIHLVLKE